MAQHSFGASALIDAPADRAYGIIADYRNGHPRIIPKAYFEALEVEQGGSGAGTVINFRMKVMGQVQSFHSVISEPEPGRVLVEADASKGTATTFRVEPREGGHKSYVTISTEMQVPDGLAGRIQGWLMAQLLRPIYFQELKQLEAVARG